MKRFLMGNQAIALGAINAGVNLVSGYPGTPSSEILETVAANNPGDIYVEWSANEKAAMEVAAGASYAGARVMVTMKQVGLSVAADALLSLAYVGIKGGFVVVVADDPGPISSQTEQDSRCFGVFAKLPVFDPSSPAEAYLMIEDAFLLSEKYQIPVIFRPTTRICHACADLDHNDIRTTNKPSGFIKDSKWVIFPKRAYEGHLHLASVSKQIAADFSSYGYNSIQGNGRLTIAASGIAYQYCREALDLLGQPQIKLAKIATPTPFPEQFALSFLQDTDAVICMEELDPVIEKELLQVVGKHNLPVKVYGKLTGNLPEAGEYSVETVSAALADILGIELPKNEMPQLPDLPNRPPVLCAACPHRASFYLVKKACAGQEAVFSGDIGCYTLGNAAPLSMVDTCLCMGAGITVAQGLQKINPETLHFAFIGDSTFFASGLTGTVNAAYNQTKIIIVVLDNNTTAMTGHQPHPGTGQTMMGEISDKISIEKTLYALGINSVGVCNPLDCDRTMAAIKRAIAFPSASALIMRSPCAVKIKKFTPAKINTDKCSGCGYCIEELGCPALTKQNGIITIDQEHCKGCMLCAQICPCGAIENAITKEE